MTGFWGWLDGRLGLGGLRYPVPEHANSLAYTLGGITLVSFIGLVVTGIYLAQFYEPTPARAHVSITYIADTAFAGALIRRRGRKRVPNVFPTCASDAAIRGGCGPRERQTSLPDGWVS